MDICSFGRASITYLKGKEDREHQISRKKIYFTSQSFTTFSRFSQMSKIFQNTPNFLNCQYNRPSVSQSLYSLTKITHVRRTWVFRGKR
jgi:hypothetical protein